MKKTFAIAIIVCGLGLLPVAAQKIISTVTMPTKVGAGDAFPVQLTVTKPGITGNFKFIQRFPKGFKVEEIIGKSADAQFEWDGTQVYYRWDNITADEIKLEYTVTTAPNRTGTTDIMGQYIYYDANGKKQREDVVLLPDFTVTSNTDDEEGSDEDIFDFDDEVDTATLQGSLQTARVYNQASDSEILDEPQFRPLPRTSMADPRNVYVVRQTPYRDGGKIVVRLQINKGTFEGYGRLVERVTPQGHIEMRESKGADVEINEDDSEISFVWQNLTERDTITIMYYITTTQPTPVTIKGMFYFGNPEALNSVEVEERSILIIKDLPVPDEMPTDVSLGDYVSGKGKIKDNEQKHIARIDKNERGLRFRIQVLASRKSLTLAEVKGTLRKKRIEINETISEDYVQDGTPFPYKYVIGHFRSYEQASILRETLQRLFGPEESICAEPPCGKVFTIFYYDGDRITKQAAMMIEQRKYHFTPAIR
jgi:hypothetical protein